MSTVPLRKAVLFDLDGTLIDTTDLILKCFEHSWGTVCGLSQERNTLLQTFGMPLRVAMSRLWSNLGHTDEAEVMVERLVSEYRAFNLANHDTLAKPFNGTAAILERLKSRGYEIGVVTSKGRELGRRGLELFGLSSYFDVAIYLEDTTRHKPDPDPILTGLERLQISAASAAYVGDSPHDILAGRAAGVRTVAALWGPGERADLEQQDPDHLAESPESLLDIFD